MVLPRQLPKRGADLILGCSLGDAEGLIVISELDCHCEKFGRSACQVKMTRKSLSVNARPSSGCRELLLYGERGPLPRSNRHCCRRHWISDLERVHAAV